jgi:hypothetical protein
MGTEGRSFETFSMVEPRLPQTVDLHGGLNTGVERPIH